jgi:PAS domain S-box-containing protein
MSAVQDILDLVQESVLVSDLDGRITQWNAASERLYGWSQAEAVGRHVQDLLKIVGEPNAPLKTESRDFVNWEGDLIRLRADGRTVHVRTKRLVRRDAQGAPLDIVETGIDVTAQQGSEQRYQNLFRFVPVSLLQVDRTEMASVFETFKSQGIGDLGPYIDTHRDFVEAALASIQIVEVNQKAIELFGIRDAHELLGPAKRLWTESPEIFRRSMEERFRGASRFEAEIKIRTFDDRIVNVLYVTDFPEALNEPALGLVCLIDISDRMKAQEKLAQVQTELAHAGRVSMLGELTASIAHEVSQPITAILTNAEAGLRWLGRAEPDVAEVRALTVQTAADARRAADIIRRIRNMAVRTGPERSPTALNEVIEDVVLFLRHELQGHGVQAVLELAPDLPDVHADRVQLQQVVANLAVNAVHAMAVANQPVRRLTIRTARVDAAYLSAEIEDTGSGIPADHLDRLFQSFFTTKEGGMGIGLAICRSIVEAHGGHIEAANLQDGQGARFRFTLPTCPPAG